jgi:hypothetical protein
MLRIIAILFARDDTGRDLHFVTGCFASLNPAIQRLQVAIDNQIAKIIGKFGLAEIFQHRIGPIGRENTCG